MSPSADVAAPPPGSSSSKLDLLTSKLRAKRSDNDGAAAASRTNNLQGTSVRMPSAVQPSADEEGSAPSSHITATKSAASSLPVTEVNSESSEFSPFDPKILRLDQAEAQQAPIAVPKKRIINPRQLDRWRESGSIKQLGAWIAVCNEAVVGRKLGQEVHLSPATQAILGILDSIQALVVETPADKSSSSRFGNAAFRDLYAKITDSSASLHESIPGLKQEAIKEIKVYFDESWGNARRIDYGSGMELNFACWLYCLTKLSVFDLEKDAPAIVLKVFWRYIGVMRFIQSTYWLEPAGSHGVWGLDDYHFLPFLWGSAQLRDHKHLRPKAIHDAEIVEEFSAHYMYLACIRFINSIKTASLRWHSPMLDDISGVRTWYKVNSGMQKMYLAEVLLKLPIAQHIFFGSLLPFPAPRTAEDEADDEAALKSAEGGGGAAEEDEHGHIHGAAPHGHAAMGKGEGQAAGWGDCCGIPIPSAFAAAEQEKIRSAGNREIGVSPTSNTGFASNVRRVPFD
ncbi:Phosphotyrosyl phosphatase activator [Ceraceosorus bombacis]|uniref:Serine/threonine-protein phosphatase 2A activator n=1 Tax=Ceraceosorus bombacis TaxID=401625 RepID=A0A0P1B9P8_9BASI|nr:Phosphotyrosyl phosphatase activator [Ceraceosorus bombacis]